MVHKINREPNVRLEDGRLHLYCGDAWICDLEKELGKRTLKALKECMYGKPQTLDEFITESK